MEVGTIFGNHQHFIWKKIKSYRSQKLSIFFVLLAIDFRTANIIIYIVISSKYLYIFLLNIVEISQIIIVKKQNLLFLQYN